MFINLQISLLCTWNQWWGTVLSTVWFPFTWTPRQPEAGKHQLKDCSQIQWFLLITPLWHQCLLVLTEFRPRGEHRRLCRDCAKHKIPCLETGTCFSRNWKYFRTTSILLEIRWLATMFPCYLGIKQYSSCRWTPISSHTNLEDSVGLLSTVLAEVGGGCGKVVTAINPKEG